MASKKDIKDEKGNAVDNLNSHLTKAGEKVANNKKIIYWSLGVIGVVAAFVLSYFFIYRNHRLQNAWDSYNEALMLETQGKINGESVDSLAALKYQEVSTNFDGTPAGNLAALASAEYFYNEKKYDEAIKLIESFDLSQPILQAQSKCLLGDCFVNTQQYDKAISAYDEAIKIADGNPELTPFYLFKKANVLEHQGQYASALSCLEEIQQKYPTYINNPNLSIDYYVERQKALAGK